MYEDEFEKEKNAVLLSSSSVSHTMRIADVKRVTNLSSWRARTTKNEMCFFNWKRTFLAYNDVTVLFLLRLSFSKDLLWIISCDDKNVLRSWVVCATLIDSVLFVKWSKYCVANANFFCEEYSWNVNISLLMFLFLKNVNENAKSVSFARYSNARRNEITLICCEISWWIRFRECKQWSSRKYNECQVSCCNFKILIFFSFCEQHCRCLLFTCFAQSNRRWKIWSFVLFCYHDFSRRTFVVCDVDTWS
jgi:hypothetical protein